VFVPSAFFSALAIVMMGLPVNYPPSRLTYLLTVTLTVVTYKLWLGDKLPAVTYLSLLDKYQLLCALIILVIDFETTIFGSVMEVDDMTIPAADRACQILAGSSWVVLQLWFGWLSWHEHFKFSYIAARRARKSGKSERDNTITLKEKEEKMCRKSQIPFMRNTKKRRPTDKSLIELSHSRDSGRKHSGRSTGCLLTRATAFSSGRLTRGGLKDASRVLPKLRGLSRKFSLKKSDSSKVLEPSRPSSTSPSLMNRLSGVKSDTPVIRPSSGEVQKNLPILPGDQKV